MVAYILKKRFPETRVIYDCHEFHPQGFTENFPHPLRGIAKLLIERVEDFLVSKVDGVVTVNRKLAKRFKKNNKSVIVLPNYPPLEIFEKNERKREVFSARKVRLIYVGVLSSDRGLFRMLEMLRGLNSLGNVQLILIGKFSSSELKRRFWQKAEDFNLVNKIDYKGYLSHEETVLNLLDADIGLFLLSDNERYNWGEPVKYFEYSAAGLPVVITDLPAKRNLIEKNRNGILVSPGSSDDAVNAVRSLIDNSDQARIMSERGRRTFLKEYNWESVEHRLFDLYGSL
ncbi:MAG: glycosyltransferase family 4 protein [Clostridiales bacterium]|nr:glycosyltransferase family 4 protein [Clostridiales bacterium]